MGRRRLTGDILRGMLPVDREGVEEKGQSRHEPEQQRADEDRDHSPLPSIPSRGAVGGTIIPR